MGRPTSTCGRSGCRSASRRSSAGAWPGLGPDTERVLGLARGDRPRLRHRRCSRPSPRSTRTRSSTCATPPSRPPSCRRPSIPIATRSPTPSSSTPSTTGSHRRAGHGPIGPSPSSSRRCTATPRASASGELAHHWAAAVQPTDTAKAIHYAAARRRPGPRPARPRRSPPLVPPGRSSSSTADREASRADERRSSSGSATPRSSAASPPTGRRCSRPPTSPTRIDDVDLLVRAALTNNRGFQSVIGDVDPSASP